ncbi:MAG: pilus assembly protein PilM [Nitrospira sp.]|nr:pilus assembly protein PilM [bacterium]MBL7049776.1 pilus assembly protein PilM [Nitrospira sp.]
MSLGKDFGIYLGVEFREDTIVLVYLNNGFSGLTVISSSIFPLSGKDEDLVVVREYLKQHGRGLNGICICIPDRWVMSKFITLPAAKGRGAIDQLMSFEMERHVPFDLENIIYDFQAIEEVKGEYEVLFAAIQKTRIDEIREIIDKLELKPQLVTTMSFAVLNAIELSGMSAGGWQHAVGFIRKSIIFGGRGTATAMLYMEEKYTILAVLCDGMYKNIKSFYIEDGQTQDDWLEYIARHVNDEKIGLHKETFDKLVLAGQQGKNKQILEKLQDVTGMKVVIAEDLSGIFGQLNENEARNLVPAVGSVLMGIDNGMLNINLLSNRKEHRVGNKVPVMTMIIILMLMVVLLGMGYAGFSKNKKLIEKIDQALLENKPEISSIEKLLKGIKTFEVRKKDIKAISESEILLEVMTELAGIIPDTAWITNLHYKGLKVWDEKNEGAEIIISGFAESSSVLLPILEDSKYFEKVEFVGPIKKTKDREGFKLKAMIRMADDKAFEIQRTEPLDQVDSGQMENINLDDK